jgi:putative transposase
MTRPGDTHRSLTYGWYNPRRIQAGVGELSPDGYEDTYHRRT